MLLFPLLPNDDSNGAKSLEWLVRAMLENRLSADEFDILFKSLRPSERMTLLERLDQHLYGARKG